jgi:hypothetical protein
MANQQILFEDWLGNWVRSVTRRSKKQNNVVDHARECKILLTASSKLSREIQMRQNRYMISRYHVTLSSNRFH